MRHARRSRPNRRPGTQDGLVLISVLLVILMGTAIAMTTAHDTRYALRSAGHDRSDVQGRYGAETAMLQTLAWFDRLGPDRFYNAVIAPWKQPTNPSNPPVILYTLPRYAEPNFAVWTGESGVTPTLAQSWYHDPARVNSQQFVGTSDGANEIPLQTAPGEATTLGVDTTGSFGLAAFQPSPTIETDLYDCVVGLSEQLGVGQGAAKPVPLMCMAVSRHRSGLLATDTGGLIASAWSIRSFAADGERKLFRQRRFAHLHNASAVIETLAVPQ